MKRFNLYILLLTVFLSATSCKDDAPADDAWKTANEQAFNDIARNPAYTELPSLSNNGSIYYKTLQKGKGVKPIYYTSRVEVYYKGWFVAADPSRNIAPGTVGGQQLFDDGTPVGFPVNDPGLIEGWRSALQYMTEGDKWEIWVPYSLNYVQNAYSAFYPAFALNAPEYATLAYEIEVVKVWGVDEL